MVGLGKLGLPCAYAMASRGVTVYGHDPLVKGAPPARVREAEAGYLETIQAAEDRMRFVALDAVVANCDVVFVAVQTPHEHRFEGVTPIPDERADFDYSYLRDAVSEIVREASKQTRMITVAVISTVLPGTMDREIRPLLDKSPVTLVYTPQFIAMGTTIDDFLYPEFVLLGGDAAGKVDAVFEAVYGAVDGPRRVRTSVPNAELIKVAYNTFIGLKIAFANTLMEVCEKTGCDVDEVTGALKLAHRRLISGAYLDGGMGDGGGCHPRDNIALSWLAGELDLSYDLFNAAMEAREQQAAWLAQMVIDHAAQRDLPIGILGTAYKPGSRIVTGSPALLVKSLLERFGASVSTYDPYVSQKDADAPVIIAPHVLLVGCKHPEFTRLPIPTGSVVIDPFRYMPDRPGVKVVRLGQAAG